MEKDVKICIKCKKELPRTEEFFYVRCSGKLRNDCKECAMKRRREHYRKNKEKIKKWRKKYIQENREKVRESVNKYRRKNKEKIRKQRREYYQKNIEKIKGKLKEYRESDQAREGRKRRYIKNKLPRVMSSAILRSLRGAKGHHPWQNFVEYNTKELALHLQKTIGLTNKVVLEDFWCYFHGAEYHIDHIIPIASFDIKKLQDHTSKEFKKCWSLNNLQLLSKEENIKKGQKCLTNKI